MQSLVYATRLCVRSMIPHLQFEKLESSGLQESYVSVYLQALIWKGLSIY